MANEQLFCIFKLENGGQKQANGSRDSFWPEGGNGSRLPFAFLKPPFFNVKIQNYKNFVFSSVFLQRDW